MVKRFTVIFAAVSGLVLIPTSAQAKEIYSKKFGQIGDPLTPPQTRTKCVSHASGTWPWGEKWKTCKGWKTQARTMQVEYFLVASGPDLDRRVNGAVKRCTRLAAVSAAAAGYATGGTAALTAAKVTFTACLTDEGIAAASDFNLAVDTKSGWTKWK
jgi:hypothetical protein